MLWLEKLRASGSTISYAYLGTEKEKVGVNMTNQYSSLLRVPDDPSGDRDLVPRGD